MRLIDTDELQRRICGATCGCEYEDCADEGDCGYDHFISHAKTRDAIPKEVYEQVRWERDIAIDQLKSYGVGLGEKAEVCKVQHGKWLISCDSYYPYCSECNEEPKSGRMTEYCPYCGAKMDGEK